MQNLYYDYYYPKPKYLITGYLDPLGLSSLRKGGVATGNSTMQGFIGLDTVFWEVHVH